MSDRYTKIVLTVIAFCLIIIIVRDIPFVREAIAQSWPSYNGTVPVTIRGIDECSSCRWESIPVRVR